MLFIFNVKNFNNENLAVDFKIVFISKVWVRLQCDKFFKKYL